MLAGISYHVSAANQMPDSIRVIGYRTNVNFAYNIGRQQLFRILMEDKKESPNDVVDTIIVDRNTIASFCKIIKKLNKGQRLPYQSNQILLEAQYLPSYDFLTWKECLPDYRILVILFYNNRNDFLWFTTSTVDKGSKRYKISKPLKAFIGQYSAILR